MKEYIVIAAMLIALTLGLTGKMNNAVMSSVNDIMTSINLNIDSKPDFDAKFVVVR